MRIRRSDRIGFCTNKDLGLKKLDPDKGHYVYVEKQYPNGKSKVHTISAIEHRKKDKQHDIEIDVPISTKKGILNVKRYVSKDKLKDMRSGALHPIPYNDADFGEWSGIYLAPLTVDTKKIRKPSNKYGKPTNKYIKKKHSFALKPSKRKK